ncbi:MAG TPA: acyl-CoA dehydrogenase family protein [Myxococcota bacterium]|nr:acyl-CoA dehydrogenase family protein [Myxococcota bacterium]
MIDFALPEELDLLRATARDFARAALAKDERAAEAARAPSAAARDAFRAIGLAALELPEALGGAGLGALARALVGEELAAADPGAALALDPLGAALYPLAELGGERALREIAAPLLERGGRAALAVDLGGDLRVEDGRAEGALAWVPADRADLLVVLGRSGAFAVRDGAGVEWEALRGAGLRASGAAAVRLADAPVVFAASDPVAATRALARVRLYVAGLLLGTMRASSEFARAYAGQRVAFGRPIAHHQALAFLLVDVYGAVESVRALVHEAAWRVDAGADAAEPCASAFAEAVEQALFVTPNSVQVLGGHGFMQDYPVEKWMREARALGLLAGGLDAAREDAGAALAEAGPPLSLTLAAEGA